MTIAGPLAARRLPRVTVARLRGCTIAGLLIAAISRLRRRAGRRRRGTAGNPADGAADSCTGGSPADGFAGRRTCRLARRGVAGGGERARRVFGFGISRNQIPQKPSFFTRRLVIVVLPRRPPGRVRVMRRMPPILAAVDRAVPAAPDQPLALQLPQCAAHRDDLRFADGVPLSPGPTPSLGGEHEHSSRQLERIEPMRRIFGDLEHSSRQLERIELARLISEDVEEAALNRAVSLAHIDFR